jgi:hypothetical protein
VGFICGGMVSPRFVEQFAGRGLGEPRAAYFLKVAFGFGQGLPGFVQSGCGLVGMVL